MATPAASAQKIYKTDIAVGRAGNGTGINERGGYGGLATGALLNPLTQVTPGVKIATETTDVCAGTVVSFLATAVNGGTTPLFQWQLNGVNVGTNAPQYSNSALVNGDMISCIMTSNDPNATPPIVTSNTITMTVNPLVTPSVTITASQNPVQANMGVSLTATVTNGGTAPIYQWLLNGAFVGSNSSTYNYIPANNDIVRCVVTSNAACVTTSIADRLIVINVIPTAAVAELGNEQTALSLYPNPNNGRFALKGTLKNKSRHATVVEIYNALGRSVYRQEFEPGSSVYERQIVLPGTLSDGAYFLKMNDGINNDIIRFTVTGVE